MNIPTLYPEFSGCCMCHKNQYLCNNKRCIPTKWNCNGNNDCGDSSDELSNKILDLLPNKEKRLRMANKGLEIVKKYDWKQVGKLYLNFYESLLK